MHELDGWTLLTILGMTAISVITRGFFFISEREWTLPEWAERGLQYAPIAALTAVIAPDILLTEGAIGPLLRALAGLHKPESGRITLAIRPERISLTDSGNLAGEVEEVGYIGTDTLYLLKVAGQSGFRVRQQNRAGSGQPLPRGAQVRLDVPAAAIRVLGE